MPGTPGGLEQFCSPDGESPSWLRHRILIPAFEGSNPSSPATFVVKGLNSSEADGVARQAREASADGVQATFP